MNSKFIKFITEPKNWLTMVGGIVSACTLYFGIIAKIDHLENKIDKYIAVKEEKTKFIDYEISELKTKQVDQSKDIVDIKGNLFKLYAILPKELKLENE